MDEAQIKIKRKTDVRDVFSLHTHANGATYFACGELLHMRGVKHAFSTRLGGVSEGPYATLNLSFTRGDDPDSVRENVRRMAEVVDAKPEDVVCTYQTHTTNIRVVTKDDRGKGVTRERDYTDIDGLITNAPDVVLSCYSADCVPLLFFDPETKSIGVAHAGWRGSVGRMAAKMVDALFQNFGARAINVRVAIGPSICGDCYEVGEDVAKEATRALDDNGIADDKTRAQILFQKEGTPRDKYRLDLWALNRAILLQSGVLPEHIFTTDVCTLCNPALLFSHRAQGERRGNLAAFLKLSGAA